MAAYELQSGAPFSVCVIQRLPITNSAQEVTVMNGSSMTVKGIPVDAVDIHAAVFGISTFYFKQ